MASQILDLVHSLLVEDLTGYDARTASLDGAGRKAFGEVVGAAFQQAVELRFGPGAGPDGAVSAMVDRARRPYLGTVVDVDREAAGVLVRSVLGQDDGVARVLAAYDEPALARIELVLTRRLVADAGLSGATLEAFLAAAELAASPWTSGQREARSA